MSRILIVDNESPIRQSLCAMYESEGYQVDSAQDGLEATYLLQLKTYDLVIIGRTIDLTSSRDVIEIARMTFPDTKIMALSEKPCGDVSTHFDETDVEDYLSTPFARDQVARALGHSTAVN